MSVLLLHGTGSPEDIPNCSVTEQEVCKQPTMFNVNSELLQMQSKSPREQPEAGMTLTMQLNYTRAKRVSQPETEPWKLWWL